jgi:hypothetical protein
VNIPEANLRARSPSDSAGDTHLGSGLSTGLFWPIGAASLAALVDLGMSDALIARYFGVAASEVGDRLSRLGYGRRGLERDPRSRSSGTPAPFEDVTSAG